VSASGNVASRGIKGPCELGRLRFFQPAISTNIDYMHSLLEGVVKRLFKVWFEDRDVGISIRNKMELVNKRLLNVKPPSYVSSPPRSLFTWKMWRAHEFLSFILFYSLPVLFGVLYDACFFNLVKLVVTVENLLKKDVLLCELNDVEDLLLEFYAEAQEIYSESILLSCFHELIHLPECVLNFGHLNSVNCFPFEENNRKLTNMIKGRDLVGDEFFKLFKGFQQVCNQVGLVKNAAVSERLEKMNLIRSSNFKNINKGLRVYDLRESKLNDDYCSLLVQYFGSLKKTEIARKIVLNGQKYTTCANSSKFCDYRIKTKNGRYGLIQLIIKVDDAYYVIVKKIVRMLNSFYSVNFPNLKSNFFLSSISQELFIEQFQNVQKAALIKISDDLTFVTDLNISHLFL